MSIKSFFKDAKKRLLNERAIAKFTITLLKYLVTRDENQLKEDTVKNVAEILGVKINEQHKPHSRLLKNRGNNSS